ncbi:B12-binding domain-containing radical SAM protein [Rhodopseudomonas infernalis]|uniref:B12-binding domain-containing radical SAM protein n=1 Tax=Rhodopseudomonas infernalis TaxID=2897386 RepID=UPI001EE8DFE7|nr:radical SAM protein [Rhodopseudomonas infernalis]
MELPRRARGDELLVPGKMAALRERLRGLSARHDLTSVVVNAFDHRTRVLPFVLADTRLAPGGVRAIGSALADVGFHKTRIVLQQWNRNFSPLQMRLDGRIPDLFLVSSMHLHSAECDRLIREACLIEPDKRPLIMVGGPRIRFEPWHVFGGDRHADWSADVAVTGEEYVFLDLLNVLLSMRADGESMRSVFHRARASGALDEVPGIVYANRASPNGPIDELVDTGVQRLLGDLDELPSPMYGYTMLEAPSNAATLASQALPANRVKRHSPIAGIVMTAGCKFRCSYCPIPAYNQSQFRAKSGERIAEEIEQIANTFGIYHFFGADDNFFNSTQRTLDIAGTLAKKARTGRPFCKVRIGTEVTVHDTVGMRDHLPLIREAGFAAVWLGVEDMTATLVKKAQDKDKTELAFRLLRENNILPMPMMMHHDSQPLVTWKSNYGLINQIRLLRKAGSITTQVMMLTPAPGSKWYENVFESGSAFSKAGDVTVEPHIMDGNYVVASKHARPWLKQINLLLAYTYFFNPVRFASALVFSKSANVFSSAETRPEEEVRNYSAVKKMRRRFQLKLRAHLIDAGAQIYGMIGLAHTYRRTAGWAWRLFSSKIERHERAPVSNIPMRGVGDKPSDHALPGTINLRSLEPAPVSRPTERKLAASA